MYSLWYSHMHTPKWYIEQRNEKKKRVLICPEVYEAFYDFVVGIHVNSETKFEQDRGHLFGP